MENYTFGERKVIDTPCPLQTAENVVIMKVSNGSKFKNLVPFAMNKIKAPETKQLMWNAQGPAISKAISCSEIVKNRMKGLHQLTNIRYIRTEEYWEPKMEGLDRLKVNKDVPAISILLSKDPLDTSDPSYQAPGSTDIFCGANSKSKSGGHSGYPSFKKKQKMPPPGLSGEQSTKSEVPSMTRKRKRKKERGKGADGNGSEGQTQGKKDAKQGQSKSQKQRRDSQKRGESMLQSLSGADTSKMDTSETPVETKPSVKQKVSLSDKLDILTKRT